MIMVTNDVRRMTCDDWIAVGATWRDEKKTQLRERIYEVTLRLLGERGFEGASIERIANEVGIAKGTFFNYYENKEHVIGEWHRRMAAMCLAEAKERRFRTAKSAVQAVVDITAERSAENVEMVRIKSRIATGSERLLEVERELDRSFEDFFTEHVEAGKERGELRSDLNARFFAELIRVTLMGTARNWVFSGDEVDLRKLSRDRIAFLFRAAVA